MNSNSGNKSASDLDQEVPVSLSDLENGNDEPYQREIAAMQDDEIINLDDALDDDNENPVSHTLIEASENTGSEEIRDTQELEGEEQESEDRTGSLRPLYNET